MPFGGLQLTNFGQRVQNKVPQRKMLHLTRVAIGDGVLGSAASSTFTTLISERASFLISDVRAGADDSIVIFILSNEGLAEGFFFREIGIFAQDPDTNEEGLYLYDNCRSEGEYIDDGFDPKRRVKSYMRLHIKFGQTDQITITPGADPLFVTSGEFEDHIQENNSKFLALETAVANAERDIAANDARDDTQDTQIAEQGTQIGQHGTRITQLETDVEGHDQQLAALGGQIEGKAAVSTYTVSLPSSGWTGTGPYAQTVSVAGILATDRPIFGPVYSGTADEKIEQSIMAGFISECDTAAGTVTFTALLAKPEVDLTIQMEVIR